MVVAARGLFWRAAVVVIALVWSAAGITLLFVMRDEPPAGIVALVLLTGVSSGALTWWARRRMSRFHEAIARLETGDPNLPHPGVASDAFGALDQTIAETAGTLQRRLSHLQAEAHDAHTILDSMVESVVALDLDGRMLWLNYSAQRLIGVAPDQAMGRRFTELFRSPDVEAVIQEALSRRQPSSREVRTSDLQERVIRFQAVPCEGDPRRATVVLVAHDVTEMRRLERLRREFVANVSHELKTPLTSIRSLVETLLGGALEDPAANRRFVSLIEQDTVRLTRLIDDLLELSQIESKATQLAQRPVNLRALLEDLRPRFAQRLQSRRVTLELLIAPDVPAVAGDDERLRQMFVNLLDNAIKFNTTNGQIRVSALADGAALRVRVEDTGIGIPPEDVPRIFERFYRVDKARSRELGGTGLGLSIVKHLVELHHGRIDVDSHVGHGSVFTLTLPLWEGPPRVTS